jgi:hypothetical protein
VGVPTATRCLLKTSGRSEIQPGRVLYPWLCSARIAVRKCERPISSALAAELRPPLDRPSLAPQHLRRRSLPPRHPNRRRRFPASRSSRFCWKPKRSRRYAACCPSTPCRRNSRRQHGRPKRKHADTVASRIRPATDSARGVVNRCKPRLRFSQHPPRHRYVQQHRQQHRRP